MARRGVAMKPLSGDGDGDGDGPDDVDEKPKANLLASQWKLVVGIVLTLGTLGMILAQAGGEVEQQDHLAEDISGMLSEISAVRNQDKGVASAGSVNQDNLQKEVDDINAVLKGMEDRDDAVNSEVDRGNEDGSARSPSSSSNDEPGEDPFPDPFKEKEQEENDQSEDEKAQSEQEPQEPSQDGLAGNPDHTISEDSPEPLEQRPTEESPPMEPASESVPTPAHRARPKPHVELTGDEVETPWGLALRLPQPPLKASGYLQRPKTLDEYTKANKQTYSLEMGQARSIRHAKGYVVDGAEGDMVAVGNMALNAKGCWLGN